MCARLPVATSLCPVLGGLELSASLHGGAPILRAIGVGHGVSAGPIVGLCVQGNVEACWPYAVGFSGLPFSTASLGW